MSTHANPRASGSIGGGRALRPLAAGAVTVVLAAALGLGIGVATFIAQGRTGGPWAALANSVSAWLVAPWLVGLLCRRGHTAAAAGLACCLLQLIGYDTYAHLQGYPVDVAHDMYWALAAVAGGPVFGLAGHAWRFGPSALRGIGPATLAAAFTAEGLVDYLHELHYVSTALLWLVIAAGISLATLRGWRQWRWLAVTVPIAIVLMLELVRLPL